MANDDKTPDWIRDAMKDPEWRQKNPEVAALHDAETGEFNATPSQVADMGKRAIRRSQEDDEAERSLRDSPVTQPMDHAELARLVRRKMDAGYDGPQIVALVMRGSRMGRKRAIEFAREAVTARASRLMKIELHRMEEAERQDEVQSLP